MPWSRDRGIFYGRLSNHTWFLLIIVELAPARAGCALGLTAAYSIPLQIWLVCKNSSVTAKDIEASSVERRSS
jgi:hypothetical protein